MVDNSVRRDRWMLIIACLLVACWGGQNTAVASDEIEKSGDGIAALISAMAYGATFHLDDAEGRCQFYKSFAANAAVTYGLKNIIDKQRPDGRDESFPSMHTSTAFQGAAFIHKRYGVRYALPAYAGAAFVGYSRVESDNHYPEDVFAGAAIGLLSSLFFTDQKKKVVISPSVGHGTYGVTVGMKW
jgi:membrane-associated phospholipid phosphatase